MRKVFLLGILFVMSFALNELGLQVGTGQSILLAIGFVILSAYTLSEIGSSLTLPRVTGYILTGLLLGPFALKILSSSIVEDIRIFNTLAIGLIALTAGLELHFQSLKKAINVILTTSALKIGTLALLVCGSFFVMNASFDAVQLATTMEILAVGAIFTALCIGTSPAISLAVISETGAKGRMSQVIMGSAIVKDVVMVVALAVALSFAKPILGGQAGGGGFLHLMEELFYSIIAGSILGGLFIAYIRFVGKELFLFILAMILTTAEISAAIHLELLLVFIVAGAIIRNFSKTHETLHHALEKVSLPVFVLFFTNVGAGLNLQTTWEFLPVAGTLFFVRGVAFFISSWLAGKWHSEKPALQKNIWMGYLPQAGVTLGLIAIATKAVPEKASLIENIGMGLVTLNLLIGPITMRLALKRGKETSDNMEELEKKPGENIAINQDGLANEKASQKELHAADAFDNIVEDFAGRLTDPRSREEFEKLSYKVYDVFKKQQLGPQKAILHAFANDLNTIYNLTEQDFVSKIDSHLERMGHKGIDIYNVLKAFQVVTDASPVLFSSPLSKDFIHWNKKDSLWIRSLKFFKRPKYWFQKEPVRSVPFRKVAKYNLEPFLGGQTLDLIHSWYRLLGRHIDAFQTKLETKTFSDGEITSTVLKENEAWVAHSISDFIAGYRKMANDWVQHIQTINSIYLSDSSLRYSQVEPEIKEAFEQSSKASQLWEEKFVYCRNRLKVIVQTALLGEAVENLLDLKFFSPVADSQVSVDQLVQDVTAYFNQIQETLQSKDELTRNDFQSLHQATLDFSKNHLQADRKSKYIRGNFRLLNRDISMNLKKSLPKEAGSFQIASEQTQPHRVRKPSEIVVKKINLHELFEQSILINFLPLIEEKIEGISNYLESLLMEMEQAFSILTYAFGTQGDEETETSEKESVQSILATIETEKEKILELHTGLSSYIEMANESATQLIKESEAEVKSGIERFSVVSTAKNRFRNQVQSLSSRYRERKLKIQNSWRKVYRTIKNSTRFLKERDIDVILKRKITSQTLDTTTIRRFIDETYSIPTDIQNLPRVYFRLYSLDPIQDKRFFVAHREILRSLHQQTKAPTSSKMLILGSRGMGKSSLLNIAQMDIRSKRLIRIEDDPQRPPIDVLAEQLSAPRKFTGLLRNLREHPTTIIIDNIDHWLQHGSVEKFIEFLQVVKESPSNCNWIFSMTKCNFSNFESAFKVRSIFNKLIDLNAAGEDITKEMILSRHRLSGMGIQFPQNFAGDIALKLGFSDPGELFFKVLHDRAQGHLRHTIFLWLASLKKAQEKKVSISFDKGIDRGLPFLSELSETQKFILAQVYRYHRRSINDISKMLGTNASIVTNDAQYLEAAGLITSRGIERNFLELETNLVHLVGRELKRQGLIHE